MRLARRPLAPLMAMQRLAGNRAVSSLLYRPPAAATPIAAPPAVDRAQPARVPVTRTATVQRDPKAPAADPQQPPALEPVMVPGPGLDKAVKNFAGTITRQGDALIMGAQPDALRLYDKSGSPLTAAVPIKLPEGTHFNTGVFVCGTAGAPLPNVSLPAGVFVRLMMLPGPEQEYTLGRAGEVPDIGLFSSAIKKPEPKAETPKDQGPYAKPAADAAAKEPDAHKGLVLESMLQNAGAITRVIAQHTNAWVFLVVPSSSGGSSKGGKGKTSGFGGELKGKEGGIVPDLPPWPATLSGPRMQPFGGIGSYSIELDYSAFGSNTVFAQVANRVGMQVFYRWELYDVTEAAHAARKRDAAGVAKTKAELAEAGAAPDDLPPELKQSMNKTGGTEVGALSGATAHAKKDLANLSRDQQQAQKDLRDLPGDTITEKTSNAVANYVALELQDEATLATLAKGALTILAEVFAGKSKNEIEIPWPKESAPGGKVYVVRSVAQPAAFTDPDGTEHIAAATVRTMAVEISDLTNLVKEAMGEPDARLKKSQQKIDAKDLEIELAKKGGKDASVKQLELEKGQLEAAKKELEIELTGDPAAVARLKLDKKKKELQDFLDEAHSHGMNDDMPGVRGRKFILEHERDEIRDQLNLIESQDKKRLDNTTGLANAMRIQANLVSEITGQTYPLLLSAGPKANDAGKHVWQVSDGGSKNGEMYEGRGATPSEALWHALEKFAGDATYGDGLIGVSVPAAIVLEEGAVRARTLRSAPRGWSIAKARIDDLVQVLMILGLFVPGVGEVAAVVAASVAAVHVYHRWVQGTLRFDESLVSDVIGVLGGVLTIGQEIGNFVVRQVGNRFVLLTKEANVEAAALDRAAEALSSAKSFAAGIESANHVLGYAGILWGDMTAMGTLMDIGREEAAGTCTHADARRRRAEAISGAIQGHLLMLAGDYLKYKKEAAANKFREEAPAEKKGQEKKNEGQEKDPGDVKKDETSLDEATRKKEEGDRKQQERDQAMQREEEEARRLEEAAKKEADRSGEGKEPSGRKAGAPSRAEATRAFHEALGGRGDLPRAAIDLIDSVGNWKKDLASIVQDVDPKLRPQAEQALVAARADIIDSTWSAIMERFPSVGFENAGTVSFKSDIDLTVRPGQEATGPGADIAEQIRTTGEAAKALAEALRRRFGGRETDAVLDTNVYSFIGEGKLLPIDPAGRASRGTVVREVGLAEQLRGMGSERFKQFEKTLLDKFKDTTGPGTAEAKQKLQDMLAKAHEFYDARVSEQTAAEKKARDANHGAPDAAVKRIAREELVGAKKAELAELVAKAPPDLDAIALKQAEILWFEPDAYATSAAFDQAVAHGQRLRAAASTAQGIEPKSVVADKEAAAQQLEATKPDAAGTKAARSAADLAARQLRLLESARAEREREARQTPVDTDRVAELDRRIAGLEETFSGYATQKVISNLMDATMGANLTSAERLAQAAAAASSNLGMMADHVKHATGIDAALKAAAKYGNRIVLAEMLGGVGTMDATVARTLAKFTESRWAVTEEVSIGLLRDMLLDYATRTQKDAEIVRDATGNPIGVTDELKQSFVNDVQAWGSAAVSRLDTMSVTAEDTVSPKAGPATSSGGTASDPGGPPPAAGKPPAQESRPAGAGKPPAQDSPAGAGPKEEQHPNRSPSDVKTPTGGEAGAAGTPGEPPMGRVFTLLVTDGAGVVPKDSLAQMTTTSFATHPNRDAIVAELRTLGVVVVEDPTLSNANAVIGRVRVVGPMGAEIVRTQIKYKPDVCTPQHFQHELNHLRDYVSGKLDTNTVQVDDWATFEAARAAPFDDLWKQSRTQITVADKTLAGREIGIKQSIDEIMNHLRDIDEYAQRAKGDTAEDAMAKERFTSREQEVIDGQYIKTVRGLIYDQTGGLTASQKAQLEKMVREYISNHFPELPGEFSRLYPQGRSPTPISFWKRIGVPEL